MTKKKTRYIERKEISPENLLISFFGYPMFLVYGIVVIFFNFIYFLIKSSFFIIPFFNSSPFFYQDQLNVWENFEDLEFSLEHLKEIKKYEVKEE